MGSLSNFNSFKPLSELINEYKLEIFVETGCYRGNSLDFALKLGFDKLFSCDIDQEAITNCNERFITTNKIQLYHKDSISFLRTVLPAINKNALFWLDAHLPGFDKTSGQVYEKNKHNFPLEKESTLINNARKDFNDIILIDDLRIYEDGEFESGNWTDRNKFGDLDLSFLDKYDYNVQKFYQQEGYIILT